jgi:hypothetical protein
METTVLVSLSGPHPICTAVGGAAAFDGRTMGNSIGAEVVAGCGGLSVVAERERTAASCLVFSTPLNRPMKSSLRPIELDLVILGSSNTVGITAAALVAIVSAALVVLFCPNWSYVLACAPAEPSAAPVIYFQIRKVVGPLAGRSDLYSCPEIVHI